MLAGTDNQGGGAFNEISAGGQLVDEGAVEFGQAFEVELPTHPASRINELLPHRW